MEKIAITTTLKTMALRYDYVTICKDMKSVIVHTGKDKEFGMDAVQRQIELVNPVDYTSKEVLKKYDPSTVVIKWQDTYTEDGKETMAVVLRGDK